MKSSDRPLSRMQISPRLDNAAQLHQIRLVDIAKYTLLRCRHVGARRSMMHATVSEESTGYHSMILLIRAASCCTSSVLPLLCERFSVLSHQLSQIRLVFRHVGRGRWHRSRMVYLRYLSYEMLVAPHQAMMQIQPRLFQCRLKCPILILHIAAPPPSLIFTNTYSSRKLVRIVTMHTHQP
jgi:hypothetical protein